jgi:putative tricarboxylic transport membrane protein
MARADLATGAVLFVLSVAVIYGAWTMDRLEIRQIHPSSAPGLLPGLLGIALAVTSIMLILKAVRSASGQPGEPRDDPAASGDADTSNPGAAGRLIGAAVLCLVYALGLVGRMPFWLATALFVTSFIAIFEWERGGGSRRRAVRLAWAVFLGLATGLVISYAFRDLFLVRLP